MVVPYFYSQSRKRISVGRSLGPNIFIKEVGGDILQLRSEKERAHPGNSRMSVITVSIPKESAAGYLVEGKTPIDLIGYKIWLTVEDSTHKSLKTANQDGRAKCWMSRDISICANSEFSYAMYPGAIVLIRNNGAGEYSSDPLAMVLKMITHRLNPTDAINFLVRAEGHRFYD